MKTRALKKYPLQIAFMTISFVVAMIVPFLLQYLVDNILLGGKWSDLNLWFCVSLCVALLGNAFMFYFSTFMPVRIGIKNSLILERNSLKNILRLPQPSYAEKEKGYYYNVCTNSCYAYGDLHEEIHLNLISNIFFCSCVLGVIAYISMRLFLLFLVYVVIQMIVSFCTSKPLFHIQKDVMEKQDVYLNNSRNIIENKSGINAIHVEDYFIKRFAHTSELYGKHITHYRFLEYLAHDLPGLISQCFKIVFLFSAAYMIMHHVITIGVLLMVYQYVDYLSSPVSVICSIIMRYRSNKEHIKRVDNLSEMAVAADERVYEEPDEKTFFSTASLDLSKGRLEEDHLFHMKDITLKKNGFYVIKGRNGTGKSMFLNFLLGYLSNDFSKGNYSLSDDVKKTVLLTYPFFAVNGSVEDNLFGIPRNNELESILNIDFIDEVINGSNINLSYGQQQKLSLLRVLGQEAPSYFLDEPLSNLDQTAQDHLVEYLAKQKGKKTFIVVMHDAKMDHLADQIYTIHDHILEKHASM